MQACSRERREYRKEERDRMLGKEVGIENCRREGKRERDQAPVHFQ